jgi:hypothetical protein
MIMAKSRLVSSGGCNEVVVEGFGGGGVAEGAAGRVLSRWAVSRCGGRVSRCDGGAVGGQ